MAEFVFRLQKVFECRELEVKWAEEHMLRCMANVRTAEAQLDQLESARIGSIQATESTVSGRKALEAVLSTIGEQERTVRMEIRELENEVLEAREVWIAKKKDMGALEKLKETALEGWKVVEDRRIQNEMDEWAIQMRRVS